MRRRQVQLPPAQVLVHVPEHVCLQAPPAQESEHEPVPLQLWVHEPAEHSNAHVALPLQDWMQLPPLQS
jgi:hypothetical protein